MFAAAAIGAVGALQPTGAVSRVLGFTNKTVAKGFMRHGKDFGLVGNWNLQKAAEFRRAINQHINAPGTRIIQGTYRGAPVTHYLNPNTALNVMADSTGNYVSGWQLSVEQLKSVLGSGRLF